MQPYGCLAWCTWKRGKVNRVGSRATLITSQLAVNVWHAWLDDPTVADAILDRIVHSSHRIALKGPSLRKEDGTNEEEQ